MCTCATPTHTHPADYGRPQISTQADPRRQSESSAAADPLHCPEVARNLALDSGDPPWCSNIGSTDAGTCRYFQYFGLGSVCHGQSVITSQLRPSDSLSARGPDCHGRNLRPPDLLRTPLKPPAVTSWVAVSGGGSAPVSRDRQRSLPSEATSLALDLSFSPGARESEVSRSSDRAVWISFRLPHLGPHPTRRELYASVSPAQASHMSGNSTTCADDRSGVTSGSLYAVQSLDHHALPVKAET